MAKNWKKKEKGASAGAAPMDVSTSCNASDCPQAMDTSERNPSSLPALGPNNRKIKKGVTIRRSKSIIKQKAIARAISSSEKIMEKVSKNENKMLRIKSAKSLYD